MEAQASWMTKAQDKSRPLYAAGEVRLRRWEAWMEEVADGEVRNYLREV